MDALLRLIALVLMGYLAVCTALYVFQNRLIFFPQPLWQNPDGSHVRPASFERPDATLRGWIVNPESSGPLVIYFGGNAEELSTLVEAFARLRATTVLMNYRGYGESDGKPSADQLISDARALVAAMHQQLGGGRELILFGRSLGSGLAVLAADAAPVDGAILMSPYRSLRHLARRVAPFAPVGWLLRHRIDAETAAGHLPDRTLILHARMDVIIPAGESQALAQRLAPPPRVVGFEGGHNTPLEYPQIWREVRAFIES